LEGGEGSEYAVWKEMSECGLEGECECGLEGNE